MRDFRLLSYPLHQEMFNFDHKWIITFSVRVQSNLNFPKGSPKIYRTCNANLKKKKKHNFSLKQFRLHTQKNRRKSRMSVFFFFFFFLKQVWQGLGNFLIVTNGIPSFHIFFFIKTIIENALMGTPLIAFSLKSPQHQIKLSKHFIH